MFSWLKSWRARSAATAHRFAHTEYQGFNIHPEPLAENGQYRLHGRITRVHEGITQEYRLVRSDLLPSAEQAAELMVSKAKRVIDENGSQLFS